MALLDIHPHSSASLGPEDARLTGCPYPLTFLWTIMATHARCGMCSSWGADGGGVGVSGGLDLHSDMQGHGAEVFLVCPVAQNGVCNGVAGLHAGLRHSATFQEHQ